MRLLYLSIAILSMILVQAEELPLAEGIASKDLAITNQKDFENKLKTLIEKAQSLQSTLRSTKQAEHIRAALVTMLDIYGHRYPLEPSMRATAKAAY